MFTPYGIFKAQSYCLPVYSIQLHCWGEYSMLWWWWGGKEDFPYLLVGCLANNGCMKAHSVLNLEALAQNTCLERTKDVAVETTGNEPTVASVEVCLILLPLTFEVFLPIPLLNTGILGAFQHLQECHQRSLPPFLLRSFYLMKREVVMSAWEVGEVPYPHFSLAFLTAVLPLKLHQTL